MSVLILATTLNNVPVASSYRSLSKFASLIPFHMYNKFTCGSGSFFRRAG